MLGITLMQIHLEITIRVVQFKLILDRQKNKRITKEFLSK